MKNKCFHPKSEFKKGNIPWNKGKKGYLEKEKHWNWQGGITSLAQQKYQSFEYKQWRNRVFKRDRFTCQMCWDNSGGNLEAHHLESFSEYPELRYDINNGITLCKKCHKKTNNYGWKNKKIFRSINPLNIGVGSEDAT